MTASTEHSPRLIPDFHGELCLALGRIEEVLFMLAEWELDFSSTVLLPWPIAGRYALDALVRVQNAIAPTQSRLGKPAAQGGRLYAPGGGREHRPLRLVVPDPADVLMLHETAILLGHSVAFSPECVLTEAMQICARSWRHNGWQPEPAEFVEGFTRVLGLLDLSETKDTTLLTELIGANGDADITLDPVTEPAYTRTIDRLYRLWTDHSLDLLAE